jgi:hypothetical protein
MKTFKKFKRIKKIKDVFVIFFYPLNELLYDELRKGDN